MLATDRASLHLRGRWGFSAAGRKYDEAIWQEVSAGSKLALRCKGPLEHSLYFTVFGQRHARVINARTNARLAVRQPDHLEADVAQLTNPLLREAVRHRLSNPAAGNV